MVTSDNHPCSASTKDASTYEAPRLDLVGRADALTGQNFQNSNTDFNFFGETLTGTS